MAVITRAEHKRQQARAVIHIEVPAEDLNEGYDRELRAFSERYKEPGFRPGKVPREIIERKFGEALAAKAAERIVAQAYEEALVGQGLRPYKSPTFTSFVPDRTKGFKTVATVDLYPSVELADPAKLHVPQDTVTVTEKDVEEELEHLRERMAELVTRDGGVREGDVVVMDLRAFDRDGQELPDAAMNAYRVEVRRGNMPDDVFKGILGMRAGEEKEIVVKYPADFPAKRLAGQKVTFRVRMAEVKEKRLPALDDAFAAEVDANFKTVEELRADVRRHLEAAAARRQEFLFDRRILKALADASDYSIPEVFLDERTEEEWQEFLARLKWENVTLETYCGRAHTTPERLRQEIRKKVLERTREELAWLEAAKREGVTVERGDLEAEVRAIAERSSMSYEQALEYLRKTDRLSGLASLLLKRKTMERLRGRVQRRKGRTLSLNEALRED